MKYTNNKIYRFKISLIGIEPQIWREVDVPDNYNFWELHVAIQDAFGWLDYHLHEFIPNKKGPTGGKNIGLPESELDDSVIADWDISLKKYFSTVGNYISYNYDFGDSWNHEVKLIGILLAEESNQYPRCIAGERACPPEDCGGLWGYQDLLEIINTPTHEEYSNNVEWLKGHAKNYWPFDSEKFNRKSVKFSDPYKRWCVAFNQSYNE